MKKNLIIFVCSVLCFSSNVFAQVPFRQGTALSQNSVIYALPATTIEIKAEAAREIFTAGPYARFAQKYLGIEAEEANREAYFLKSLSVQPIVEADLSQMYVLEIKDKNAAVNFLSFSSEGLLLSLEQTNVTANTFQFPTNTSAAFKDRGVESNLGSERVTLYRSTQTNGEMNRVPVQQNQVVEKNPERRAEEAANVIFNLRKKRIELIGGDVDGIFNGDGLRAALDEIKRLEDEYLSLFLGKTTTDNQSAVFYVTPVAAQQKQLYVAFRFSDTQGLLSESNVAGRPIILELLLDMKISNLSHMVSSSNDNKLPLIAYRMPEMIQLRINDGQTTLLQTRMNIYQMGKILSFPANLQVRK